MPVCLRGRDVGLPHFAGRQFAVVKIWEDAGTKFVVWAFVWESVVGQHWVCGDAYDVKLECDLVGVRSGVEKGNVADGVTAHVEDEMKIVDVLNDVVNVVKSENGIGVHGGDVEGEWSAVGIWIDVDVVGQPVDVVGLEVEVWRMWLAG